MFAGTPFAMAGEWINVGRYGYLPRPFSIPLLGRQSDPCLVRIMRLPNDKALPEGGRPDRVRQPLKSIGTVGLCCGVPAAACKYL